MSAKPRLLVVDDDEDLRSQMRWALADEFEISLAGSREEALEQARAAPPAVVTLDLGLPPHPGGVEEGFATLEELRAADTGAKVVVITGREDRAHALRAIDQGAYDFFVKPIDVEELKVVLRRALKLHALERENRELRQQTASAFEGMLGTSPRMQEVFAAIRKVATVDAPVLVLGESGTGKELAAHAIHRLGARVGRALRPDQLRRHPRGAARERAVRPREGRPSPAPTRSGAAGSRPRTAARCSWTRSASCRRRCR